MASGCSDWGEAGEAGTALPEESFEGRRIADGAALELGHQDRCAVAGPLGRGTHVRHGRGQLASLARTNGEHTALIAPQATGGVRSGDRRERDGIGAETGQEDRGDGPPSRQPHQVETERCGADQ